MDVRGASAIVTGAGSGLGAALATRLAQEGASVVVLDRDGERAREVARRVGGIAAIADVANEDEVRHAIDVAIGHGPLRILANCAGINRAGRVVGRSGEPLELTTFELVLRVNLTGTFNCIRLAAAAMARQDPLESGERGSILNTASIAAFDGQIGQCAYSASKGGIVGMTLPLARDLAMHAIRINTVAPGLFDTPIYGVGEAAERQKAQLGQSLVFPERLGRPEDFASMAFAVLTNAYMNGEVVRIDGAVRLPPR